MPRQTGFPSTYTPRPRGTDQHKLGPQSASTKVYAGPGKIAGKLDPLGGKIGLFGRARRRPPDYLYKDEGGGWESLLQGFEGGASSADAIQDLLSNFKGTPEQFADFMEIAGPLMGALESRRLEGSEGLAYMSDPGNWDLGAMGAYGAAAGQIGKGTRQAIQTSEQQMAAAGLGRGSARSAARGMLEQQGAFQQADMRSQLEQRAAQNRMGSANQLFDAHRTMSQLALGQQITPRITSPQGSDQGMGGVAQGAATGASLGGGWGALVGGGLGYYQEHRNRNK